jgi:hypothetical protein
MRWLLVAALLAGIFHRPLIHFTARVILIRVAAWNHLNVDAHFSGSVFTNLTVTGIHAEPGDTKPNPLRRLEIDRVRLDYSLRQFFKYGLGELLRSYEIGTASIEIDVPPENDQEPRKPEKPVPIGEILNTILGQPALYADRVRIENVNVTVRADDAVTKIEHLHLLLDPEKIGEFKIARLQIPGVPVWENIAAETSYAGRNFYVRHVSLAPDISIEEFNFDASQRAKNKGGATLTARVFGGTLHLSLAGTQLDKRGENLARSYDTTLKIDAAEIPIDKTAAYFGAPPLPPVRLHSLALVFTGEPEKPRTWRGSIAARLHALTLDRLTVDAIEVASTFEAGHAKISAANAIAGKNAASLDARIGLPESVNDFPMADASATLKLDAPDLPSLTTGLPQSATGTIRGGGPITMHAGKLTADFALDAEKLATPDFSLGSAKLTVSASKNIDTLTTAPLDSSYSHITVDVADVRVQTFAVDSARLDIENHNNVVTLHGLDIRRGDNSVTAQGTWQAPKDFKDTATSPVDAQFSIKAPKLEAFGIAANGRTLSGHLDGAGSLKLIDAALSGRVDLDGGDFQLGDFKTQQLAAKVRIADNTAEIEKLSLRINTTDQVSAAGKVGVQAPFPYDGTALVEIRNLSALQPLLAVFDVKQPVAGSVHIDWSGKGESAKTAPLEHSGTLELALQKGRFDKIDLSEIKLAGLYGPGFASSTELHIASGATDFTGALEIKEGKLRLRDIDLQQAKATVFTGYVILPIDLDHPQQPIPLDQRIAANLNANMLDVEKLLASFGVPSPVSGNFTANFFASGTLLDPVGHLKLAAREVKSKAVPHVSPAQIDLDLHYSNKPAKELTLNAVVKQPQIQPLTIKGRAPFDLDETVKAAKINPALALDVDLKLPPSALAIVPQITGQVRRIDGTGTIDVHVGGTLEKPVFSGAMAVDLKGARMADENIPALGAFRAKVGFASDTITFNTFDGELGGGTFKLGGAIKLPKLTEPVFDLHLLAREVLLKRDDTITIRADTDINVSGPLKAGTVSGSLFLTQSRFFKEIDILPIALPGRKAKPAPKAVENQDTTVSFPQPPLRDWKFDIAIKTRPKDSFLVRGNLANGAAALDLHFAGTGLAPYLEGVVRVEQFKATLPFSSLNVSRGFVYFNKDAPFQPSLDLQCESQVRDYTVHAYIYGRASEPQIQLSSEPPLPYSDIVSLLATGTTTSELGGNAGALASRAAMLAVQELYRKVFHRSAAPAPEKEASTGSVLDRFQIELGALDNRTGGQQVMSRFKISDQLYLMGDLGNGGRFTGSLKYLIRFR